MDGKVFNTIIAPHAGEKEVNSLTKFIFDLQRFATVTLTEFAADETAGTSKYYTLDTKTGVQYATVEEALAAVDSGDTVKLGSSINVNTAESGSNANNDPTVTTNIIKSITIDLAGYTWDVGAGLIINDSVKYVGNVAAEETRTVKITDSKTTATGSTYTYTGKIYSSTGQALTLKSAKSSVTVDKAEISSDSYTPAQFDTIVDVTAGELILDAGATLTSKPKGGLETYVVAVSGSDAKLTMKDGSQIIADNKALNSPGAKSSHKGNGGVLLTAGATFDMEGGKIETDFDSDTQNIMGDSSSTHDTYGTIYEFGVMVKGAGTTFNMTGGEVKVYNNYAVAGNGSNNDTSPGPIISITGDSKVTSNGDAAIYLPQLNGTTVIGTTSIP